MVRVETPVERDLRVADLPAGTISPVPRVNLGCDHEAASVNITIEHGRTIDISESGLAAISLMKVEIGELVGLDFDSEVGPVHVWAVVRSRVAFRYGFEFVRTGPALCFSFQGPHWNIPQLQWAGPRNVSRAPRRPKRKCCVTRISKPLPR
jgi:hypothetical protein